MLSPASPSQAQPDRVKSSPLTTRILQQPTHPTSDGTAQHLRLRLRVQLDHKTTTNDTINKTTNATLVQPTEGATAVARTTKYDYRYLIPKQRWKSRYTASNI